MKRITKSKALELILESNGTIFSAVFTKKDGSERYITGRLGVKKLLTGKGMSYDPIERGLVPIYEIHKDQHRMINIKTLVSLQLKGINYSVKQDDWTL